MKATVATERTKYGVHPSQALVELFREKPYQGQDPEKASVLVIGNDANYSPAISGHSFFKNVLDYHVDGVSFWKKHQSHHPFLLADYPFDRRTGGIRYHRNFAKMSFAPADAHHFSFVELLDVPTIGNTGSDKKLFLELLSKEHLSWLEDLIFVGRPKFVLVNQTLAGLIKNIHKRFRVLSKLAKSLHGSGAVPLALESDRVVIYNGYSFSHAISNSYIQGLEKSIRNFILHASDQ